MPDPFSIYFVVLLANLDGHTPNWWNKHPEAKAKAAAIAENSHAMGTAAKQDSLFGFIASWPVVAIVGPAIVLLGFGVLSMTPPEVRVSQLCLLVGYLIVLMRIAYWVGFERTDPLSRRLGFVISVFVATGILWFFSNAFALSKLNGVQVTGAEVEPFAVRLYYYRTPGIVDPPPMWVGNKQQKYLSPVDLIFGLSITNEQPFDSQLADVDIEVLTDNGDWVKLIPLRLAQNMGDTPNDTLFSGPIKSIQELKLTASTLEISAGMLGQILKPHVPIKALEFYEVPPGVKTIINDTIRVVLVRENSSTPYIAEIRKDRRYDPSIDHMCFTVMTDPMDLSDWKIQRYENPRVR